MFHWMIGKLKTATGSRKLQKVRKTMANEKKNGTLEEIIMEMLKEGKAVRIPIKDVVDKLQENVKAAEDVQEAVQHGPDESEAVPQGGQVKTVPINIHIDNLHITS